MGEILIAPKLEVGAPADHKGDKPEYHRPCAMDTAPPVDINELVESNPIQSVYCHTNTSIHMQSSTRLPINWTHYNNKIL